MHRIAVGSIALASGLFIAAPATSGSEIRGNLYSLPPIASLNGTRIEIRVSVNPRSTAATTALRIKDLLGEQKDRELDVVVRTDGRFAIEIPDDPKNQLLW